MYGLWGCLYLLLVRRVWWLVGFAVSACSLLRVLVCWMVILFSWVYLLVCSDFRKIVISTFWCFCRLTSDRWFVSVSAWFLFCFGLVRLVVSLDRFVCNGCFVNRLRGPL